jgi:alkaline phosphatase D
LEPGVTQLVSDLDYCNLRERGLMIVTFTPEQATAEWRFVDSIKQQDYQIVADLGKTLTLAAGSTTLT